MSTAFINGTVFIGDGRVLDKATVVVEGDRIAEIKEYNDDLPPDTARVDLKECTLFPGFIDCHVHLCLDGSADPIASLLQESVPELTLKAAQHVKQTLMSGVTTIRDLGGRDYVEVGIRNAVNRGLIQGPRILASGRMITMTGGHGWNIGAREADGPDEVRKAAREQIKKGVDIVKFMATGGVMTPGVEAGIPQLCEHELRAGIEEAHKAGRKTAAHAQGTEGILNALRAGIDSIEHGVGINKEVLSLLIERESFLVPTLAAPTNIHRRGADAGIPDFVLEKTKMVRDVHLESVRRAHEAGVQIAMGTDAGTPFNRHGNNLEEIKNLVDVGFSAKQAFMAATSTAARALGLDNDLGIVEAGRIADLVVMRGNPLDDIDLLTKEGAVKLVMQKGKIFKLCDCDTLKD